jgi:site-specific DNA-adenine methylase
MLRPFFSYFGGKWRAAPRYPAPRHKQIIEPFAGSAGYSLRYSDRDVLLVEKYHVLYGIWSYLIRVREEEILGLPNIPDGGKIIDIHGICQEAQWLIGFCEGMALAEPRRSKRDKGYAESELNKWSARRRQRIASQLHAIRHWRVLLGSYEDIEVGNPATWFVDPPYRVQGIHYKHKSKDINYEHLGEWCRSLTGQVIVCEGQDADWLPFEQFFCAQKIANRHHANKVSPEMIWTSDRSHVRQPTLF